MECSEEETGLRDCQKVLYVRGSDKIATVAGGGSDIIAIESAKRGRLSWLCCARDVRQADGWPIAGHKCRSA